MSKVVIFLTALFMALGGTAFAVEDARTCPDGMIFDDVAQKCVPAPTDESKIDKLAVNGDDTIINDDDEDDSDMGQFAVNDDDDPDDDNDLDDPDV